MKVKKNAKLPDPQYPTRRQFSEYTTLLGVAAIGLSTVTGLSAPLRTAGVPLPPGSIKGPKEQVAEPRPTETNCPIQQTPEARLRGDIAVEPKAQLLGVPPLAPPQATNRQDQLSYIIQTGDSLSFLALRFLGDRNRWQEISKLNPGLKADTLKVGQIILIPVRAATNSTQTPTIKGEIPGK